jgi:hypothetical protein
LPPHGRYHAAGQRRAASAAWLAGSSLTGGTAASAASRWVRRAASSAYSVVLVAMRRTFRPSKFHQAMVSENNVERLIPGTSLRVSDASHSDRQQHSDRSYQRPTGRV